MSIVVEHEKRRKDILEKALDVFMDEGFEDATFQKIADRCAITRTTLYIYFKNKKEIFNYSIKLLLMKVENDIQQIRADDSLGIIDKITRILSGILQQLEENRRLLSVILDYLLHLSKSDSDPETRVRRRTLRLRHILASMVIEGVKAGELSPVNIKFADDFLYSFIEAAIFRLVVLKRGTVEDLKQAATLAVARLAAEIGRK
ncbi:MAG: TetR/AcrR family transcriptional regulator [Treponema sp.]|jgi:AcrR family transcriptional regulator|nr:TetR/AcrR family transcriptional regulator [Treponema sp.]